MPRLILLLISLLLFPSLLLAAGPASGGGGRGGPTPPPGADAYVLGPDSKEQPGVPKGKLTPATITSSQIYPGRVFNYQTYVPAEYDGSKPAALMVFQNGTNYVRTVIPGSNRPGAWRIDLVFDNLIYKKEIPLVIGVFIDPTDNDGPQQTEEYDRLSDGYARFVIEEVMPVVNKQYKITKDPEGHGTSGFSSGGICAFTMAWQRPDYFRKVVSCFGNFTSIGYQPARGDQPMIPGGDLYPTLIRKNPIKPIMFFDQDGLYDANTAAGSSYLGNQQMVSALEWANTNADNSKDPAIHNGPRYRVNHAFGDGGHTANHGGSIYPDILRWLWKGYEPRE